MIVDFLALSLLGGGAVAAVLILGRRGARPFRRGLDRLAARRGWRIDEVEGQGGDRYALRIVPADGDWTVDVRETGRSQPGRSDITSFRRAAFHGPTPAMPGGGWLVVLPALPADRLGGVALGVLSAGRLTGDRLLHDRLAGLLPEAGRAALEEGPPQPVDLPGLPPRRAAYVVGGGALPDGPARDRLAQVLGAALATWPAAGRDGPRAPAIILGPDGLRLVQGLPVHPLSPALPVLERLVDGAQALRAALTQV